MTEEMRERERESVCQRCGVKKRWWPLGKGGVSARREKKRGNRECTTRRGSHGRVRAKVTTGSLDENWLCLTHARAPLVLGWLRAASPS